MTDVWSRPAQHRNCQVCGSIDTACDYKSRHWWRPVAWLEWWCIRCGYRWRERAWLEVDDI